MKRRSSALEITIDPQDGDLCIEQKGLQCEALICVPIDQIEWLCQQLKTLAAESEKRAEQMKTK